MKELPLEVPWLTADLPGIGGRIKHLPDDFQVEEIAAYEPVGHGEHLFVWLEKRDLGTAYFQRQIAQRLGVAPGDIGMAGLKDRRAVTRQWVSLPTTVESRLGQLEGDGIRLLGVSRHTNKLRPGHLRGNRFVIRIREPRAEVPLTLIETIVQRLRSLGLPNFYGPQRFGHAGETAQWGLALLRQERIPAAADGRRPNLRSPFLRKLALSAAQALLFNACLTARLREGLFRTVLLGDVLAKWPMGGMFTTSDPTTEQRRFDARELVIAGPIFGRKTFPSKDLVAQREQAILTEFGLTPEAFAGFGKLLQGTRRHYQIYLDDLSATVDAEGVVLRFSLPAGSYATVLLGELMKTDCRAADEELPEASD